MADMKELSYRQIHLDFHTSPLIPDVGFDFDAEAFASTLEAARVESINIFAKCHHGLSYYPSSIGPMHPALKFDLLGKMIEALHGKGIACPIYTTAVWDEHAAYTHPEWLQIDSTGAVVGRPPYGAELFRGPGWKYLCLNTPYLDYLSAQMQEIVDRYPVDGMWIDIMMYSEDGCSCNACIEGMLHDGLDPTNREHRRSYTYTVLHRAMRRLHHQVKSAHPDALVFFNGRQRIDPIPERSVRRELRWFTHTEIESLPSGGWGYNHFPLFARYNQTLGLEMVGMNGRFHKSWGDFGGYKNQAALEFECFSMLAHGAKVCVGDQLHPRGALEPATYERIGTVFRSVEAKEPWCRGAKPVAPIAVMAVSDGGYAHGNRPVIDTLEAAMQLLLEDHRQFQVTDWEADLAAYRLLVLPDRVRLSAERARLVQEFLDNGGSVIASCDSGLAEDRDELLLDVGVDYQGDSAYRATYLRATNELVTGLPPSDYVSYERGKQILPMDCQVLAGLVEPYFDRDWNHFSSHQQTPPGDLSPFAYAVRKGRIIYIADPIFGSYKRHGNLVFKRIVSTCIDLLTGGRIVESNLPSTAQVTVMDQAEPRRRVVHLLHYPKERRADIDIIEEVIPLHDVQVSVEAGFPPRRVYVAPRGTDLEWRSCDGRVETRVPVVHGHQIVVIEGD